MKNLTIIVAVGCCLLIGCAAFSKKAKMEKYGRTFDSYQIAMRISDLNAVCRFVDSSAMSREDCLNRFGDIKLVDFKIMDTQADEEKMEVTQDIKVSYHFLNNVRIKDREYKQTWHYLEDSEKWLLKDGPPQFE
ncbi:uncharacterized protein Dvar_85600 [Desulfosarcina variabilis str. Montpellier]|uniref:hypothetical protein n=1 Tax=Desulfosarcina variabilis TaxID=2300 RepID=UPI003AFB415F